MNDVIIIWTKKKKLEILFCFYPTKFPCPKKNIFTIIITTTTTTANTPSEIFFWINIFPIVWESVEIACSCSCCYILVLIIIIIITVTRTLCCWTTTVKRNKAKFFIQLFTLSLYVFFTILAFFCVWTTEKKMWESQNEWMNEWMWYESTNPTKNMREFFFFV